MKNLFLLWLMYLVGKPIKVQIFSSVRQYFVDSIRIDKMTGYGETINIVLKTKDCLRLRSLKDK
jgi:hypothetical protein